MNLKGHTVFVTLFPKETKEMKEVKVTVVKEKKEVGKGGGNLSKQRDSVEIEELESNVYEIVREWLSLYPHEYRDQILEKIARKRG